MRRTGSTFHRSLVEAPFGPTRIRASTELAMREEYESVEDVGVTLAARRGGGAQRRS